MRENEAATGGWPDERRAEWIDRRITANSLGDARHNQSQQHEVKNAEQHISKSGADRAPASDELSGTEDNQRQAAKGERENRHKREGQHRWIRSAASARRETESEKQE